MDFDIFSIFRFARACFSKQKCHLIKSRISLLCCSLCWGTQLCRVFIYIKMSEIYCPATAEPQVGIQTNTNGQVFSSGGNTWHIFFTNCKLGLTKTYFIKKYIYFVQVTFKSLYFTTPWFDSNQIRCQGTLQHKLVESKISLKSVKWFVNYCNFKNRRLIFVEPLLLS